MYIEEQCTQREKNKGTNKKRVKSQAQIINEKMKRGECVCVPERVRESELERELEIEREKASERARERAGERERETLSFSTSLFFSFHF